MMVPLARCTRCPSSDDCDITACPSPEKAESAATSSPSRAASSSQPLLEFSGACAGCGETPYAKLLTQLFGDKMYLANATGCTQAVGRGQCRAFPYCKNAPGTGRRRGRTPFLRTTPSSPYGHVPRCQASCATPATNYVRAALTPPDEARDGLKAAIAGYLAVYDDLDASTPATEKLVAALESAKLTAEEQTIAQEILKRKNATICQEDHVDVRRRRLGVRHRLRRSGPRVRHRART